MKFIKNLENFDQKKGRMGIAQELLNDVNSDPNLLITGDETVMMLKPKPNDRNENNQKS